MSCTSIYVACSIIMETIPFKYFSINVRHEHCLSSTRGVQFIQRLLLEVGSTVPYTCVTCV